MAAVETGTQVAMATITESSRAVVPYDRWAVRFCGVPFSAIDAETTLRFVENRSAADRFAYVVTPNADHVVRLWQADPMIRSAYEDADLSLCDSRIVALLAKLTRTTLPVVTGSDLTALLFEYFIGSQDRVTIVGGSDAMVDALKARFQLRQVRHHNPPMGFTNDPDAVLEAARFIERWPAPLIFLALGSPQQELLAQTVKSRGLARGTALCVGASLLFLTGDLRRAPLWMQRARVEWLHRLASEPMRLWRRYLLDGPAIFRLAAQDVTARREEGQDRVRVSIVIPTFRREHLLPRLLERCIDQEGALPGGYEIVVVDNTTEASARAVVQSAARSAAVDVRYVHETRPGVSHARNRGVAEARGELIAFVDDDEIPGPTWLAEMLEAQRTYHADVVLGPVRPLFNGAPPRLARLLKSAFTQSSEAPTGTIIGAHTPFFWRRTGCARVLASNNALLVKARCIDTAEPFDPSLGLTGGEDTLFFTRLHRAGRRIVWCREALVHERVAKERLTSRFLIMRKFRDGQITSSACLRLRPRQLGTLAAWMAVGGAQLVVGGVIGPIAYPWRRQLGIKGLCMAATGLGKLTFLGRFRPQQYGVGAKP